MVSVAVVEDEASLRDDLVEYLGACGHRVIGCGDAPALARALSVHPVDIVILDVNLPGESGFSIASRLRDQSNVGIVMLTARGMDIDRVVGLELGADVYMVKPVELREIEAQIRALARRLDIHAERNRPDGGEIEAVPPPAAREPGEWLYDPLTWTLLSPSGQSLKLTANERVLVSMLVARPGEAVERTDVFRALGKGEWNPMDRSVDTMVRRLRAKGEELVGAPLPIEAVHGKGYAFTAPVSVRG